MNASVDSEKSPTQHLGIAAFFPAAVERPENASAAPNHDAPQICTLHVAKRRVVGLRAVPSRSRCKVVLGRLSEKARRVADCYFFLGAPSRGAAAFCGGSTGF